jgi:site-specific recombinase XerC
MAGRNLTREAYTLDLRQFTSWCRSRSLALFAVRRADIETFARELEARGRARATVTRRLCTIAGFYKYTVEEELPDHSPAPHVRRPRLDYESHATALDRNELGGRYVRLGESPEAVVDALGAEAAEHLVPRLQELAREAVYWPVDWQGNDDASAIRVVEREIAEGHPELS